METPQLLSSIHPGEILREEFLLPMGLTAYRLAKATGMPQTRISAILAEKRSITADTALRLSRFFGNSSAFWLGLQNDYDLEEAERFHAQALNAIVPYSALVV